MKNEVRVLGVDDAPFDKFSDKQTTVIGAFYRGGHFLDGVLTCSVSVDGKDATNKIAAMVKSSKFRPQLQAILLDGIAVGGFNVLDVEELNKRTGIPIIVTMRGHPEIEKIRLALNKLGMQDKIKLLGKAGKIRKAGKILYQCAGIKPESARDILRITTTHSNIPEPLRIAHIIASGITKGESKGRA